MESDCIFLDGCNVGLIIDEILPCDICSLQGDCPTEYFVKEKENGSDNE